MKNLDPAFAAHISTGATTLCFCWLIERLDGAKLGFTDHDEKIVFGGEIFLPANGLDGGEVASKLGAQVDTSEVLGVLSSEAISEEDIVLGRYDGAKITTYRVNWRDPDIRDTQRGDTIGEIVREDGVFRAELRSHQQAMNVVVGRRYQSLCDAAVGDSRCGIDLETTSFRTTGTVLAQQGRFSVELSGISGFDQGWLSFGYAQWTSGKRIAISDTINEHQILGSKHILVFAEPVGDWLEIGDVATLYAGCDRCLSTCRDKFFNVPNFRGFPHIPGSDAVLKYPKAGGDLDGSPLFK